MEVFEMDVAIKGDHCRAKEFLRNIWSYRGVETITLDMCSLRDHDLSVIGRSMPTVKYLSMRGNAFRSPWSDISKWFPKVIYLDLRDNAELLLHPNMRGTLEEVKELFLDASIDEMSLTGLRKLCPQTTYYNNIDVMKIATMKASASKRQKTSQASILEGDNSASRNVNAGYLLLGRRRSIVDSTEEEDDEEDEGDEDTAEGETETDNPDELLMLSA
ncbi:unnamed protein product [Heligmosomoides polygyrus]|uniref:LRRcap domain-containing protein n=1 Tax=Heligmosomoides polygyrus TaxID=6339 RepID=A0A183F881_HELPZ|nr:unnamed protein product [Heligmosomoides polygyrus]